MDRDVVEGLTEMVEIGRGGFGVVYRATESDLGRTVAVKVLPPLLDEAATRRFDRERMALGALSGHPHIITVHRSGKTADHQPFLVMEFCDRGSIGDELAARGPIPWTRAVDLVIKLAGGLETAHRAGIIHRDIKPANILLSNLGEPKLADFGIARMAGGPETQSATITASLAHAAPEVLGGTRPDARSDVYSLASTLFELLTGQAAFVDPNDESMLPILTRVAQSPVPPIDRAVAPGPIAAVITRAMAKQPDLRPATALDFGRQLAEAQRSLGLTPTPIMVEETDVDASDPASGRTQVVDGPGPGPFAPPAPSPWSTDPQRLDPANAAAVSDRTQTAPSPERRSSVGLAVAVGAAVVAVGLIAALVARSVSDSGDETTTAAPVDTSTSAPPPSTAGSDGAADTTATTAEPNPEPAGPAALDQPLAIGTLLPLTGALEFFGPATSTGVALAVADINAAGGVGGQNVNLVPGDSRDRDDAHLISEAERLVDAGVDVIVGPFTTGDSRVLVDHPSTEGVVLISPGATSPDLTALDTTDRFFRTSPTEVTMGNVTAQILIDDRLDRLAIAHVAEGYGEQLSEFIRFRYAQLGGVVVANVSYDPTGDVSPVISELAEAGAEAIVIVGFEETPTILAGLRAAGVGPSADGTPVYGVDANYFIDGDPSAIDGYRAILPQVDLAPLGPFTSRLDERGVEDYSYALESYDAAIIGALAVEASGATSGPDLAEAIVAVTRDGEKCFDFAECKRLISEGVDIDYDGLAGPYELTDDGDPRVASYVVSTYAGAERDPAADTYVFSR